MATQRDVIARYGNWYRGDDDLFTHCLILRSGQCQLLGQGLRPVTLRSFKAPVSQFKKLTAALKTIPPRRATPGTISSRMPNPLLLPRSLSTA
jgi:hypothetical protein